MRTPAMWIWLAGWALFLGGCLAPSQENHVPIIPSPRPGNRCFEPIGVMPGETGKEEVLALLGRPDEVDLWLGQKEEWRYSHLSISIFFSAELVNSIYQSNISDCTLGDIVGTLGPPEIVEVITQNNLPGPPVYPSKQFYYPSRGMVFLSPCPGALEWQACSSFRTTDEITRRGFYIPTTVEELVHSDQGDPRITFLEWKGFAK